MVGFLAKLIFPTEDYAGSPQFQALIAGLASGSNLPRRSNLELIRNSFSSGFAICRQFVNPAPFTPVLRQRRAWLGVSSKTLTRIGYKALELFNRQRA